MSEGMMGDQTMREMGEELGRVLSRNVRDSVVRDMGALSLALFAYQRLFEEGIAHSLVLRSDVGAWPPGWKLTWTAAITTNATEASDWAVIVVRHPDVRTLGGLALSRMEDSYRLHGIEL